MKGGEEVGKAPRWVVSMTSFHFGSQKRVEKHCYRVFVPTKRLHLLHSNIHSNTDLVKLLCKCIHWRVSCIYLLYLKSDTTNRILMRLNDYFSRISVYELQNILLCALAFSIERGPQCSWTELILVFIYGRSGTRDATNWFRLIAARKCPIKVTVMQVQTTVSGFQTSKTMSAIKFM